MIGLRFLVLSGIGLFFCLVSMAMAFDILQPLPETPPVPDDNPITAEKIALGKQLFFDPRLSVTMSVSCNTCHNLMAGGQDMRPLSTGANGKKGRRNAPTLWNVAFQTVLYWDGRARSLEEQAHSHLLDPYAMGMPDEKSLVARLATIPGYVRQFEQIFRGERPVSLENIAKSLASYERTLLTPNSPFDRYIRGDHSALSAQAVRGMELFNETGCLACHFGVNFAGPAPGPSLKMGDGFYELFPNHLGSVYDKRYRLADDLGRYEVSKDPGEKRMWRVALLRNIALTAPYFHNGSVATLDEAVRVMAKTQLKKTLRDEDQRAIVAFLHSLTGEFPDQIMPRIPIASYDINSP